MVLPGQKKKKKKERTVAGIGGRVLRETENRRLG